MKIAIIAAIALAAIVYFGLREFFKYINEQTDRELDS